MLLGSVVLEVSSRDLGSDAI